MARSNVAQCGRDKCGHYYSTALACCPQCGNYARKLRTDDPAMALRDKVEPSRKTVHRDGCYICEDSEYARLGMPLCYPCFKCGGHVAADECECDECGVDQRESQEVPTNG